MVLINVFASLTPIISVIGDTSSLAATRGRIALPIAVAGAKICVKLNCFWVANIRGVKDSAVKPLKASLSATNIFETPLAFEIASATLNEQLLRFIYINKLYSCRKYFRQTKYSLVHTWFQLREPILLRQFSLQHSRHFVLQELELHYYVLLQSKYFVIDVAEIKFIFIPFLQILLKTNQKSEFNKIFFLYLPVLKKIIALCKEKTL